MKKILLFLLSIIMMTSFVFVMACGNENEEEKDKPGEEQEEIKDDTIDEFELPKEDGCNQLSIYWNYTGSALDKCDVWIWYDGKDGSGNLFHKSAYGAKCVVNVPESVTEVGFIVRKNCSDPGGSSWGEATKDFDQDRTVRMDSSDVKIYLKQGLGTIYYSEDGGKTLYEKLEITFAQITDLNKIRYTIAPAFKFTDKNQFKVACGNEELTIKSVTNLNAAVTSGEITVEENLDLGKNYEITIEGYGTKAALPTKVFDSVNFKNEYLYEGDDLGATVNGNSTTFKVWAPTASMVVLKLFRSGNEGDSYKTVEMTKGEKGVWSHTEECGHGTYYTYQVTTAAGIQEAVDPYAKSAGLNGNRGMVIDLSLTAPEGWDNEEYYQGITTYSDAIIWEVHVRDFSNKIASSNYKGKYLAFTETGLTNSSGVSIGVDYLKNLGITHVHLNPVYDFATVDESGTGNQFNWGYDPKNYNVPEGSYSTNPYNGEIRVKEFKQMVQALHAAGIGVIMDVVYNHTYDGNSSFNKIVPYYYYRYNSDGTNSNGSGCGNETASERGMFQKYMVESIKYWATEYMIDGFRFDLMGLHDVNTMQAIEIALHEINPKAIIYGEGWTGGTTPLSNALSCTTTNAKKIKASEGAAGGVSVFNDAIRDGLKGSVFDAADKGYANGNIIPGMANKVAFGIMGGSKNVPGAGFTTADGGVINYVSCHDNYTLYDKLTKSCVGASEEEIVAINKLCAAIYMVSKGTPFMLAGEEMLRTKQGDSNSYKSSDDINNIDWEVLTEGSKEKALSDFYKALIELRKANEFIRYSDVTATIQGNNIIDVVYKMDGEEVGRAIINPYAEAKNYQLNGSYKLLFDGENIVSEGESVTSIPAKSVVLLKKV